MLYIVPAYVCRYYTAEGVRIYSQETWNSVTEGRGKQLVERHIDAVVQFHVFLLQCFGKDICMFVSSEWAWDGERVTLYCL